jgi:hypothetical protein
MGHNIVIFYGEELSARHPSPKLEDRPFLAIRNCLFNIYAAILHIGDRSSIHSLRMRHAMTHLWAAYPYVPLPNKLLSFLYSNVNDI